MAILNPPFALQNAGAVHTAAGDRMVISGLLAGHRQTGTQVTARGGVSRSGTGRLGVAAQATPNMTVQVFSGVAFVAGTEALSQGLYCCVSEGGVNLTVPTAHGTLPRVDAVIARVYDSAYSGVDNKWELEIVEGTPASSPVAPTLPANSLKLAEINVGPAVTSITNANILDKRVYVAAQGGMIPISSQQERDDLSAIVQDGQAVFRLDNGNMEVYWNGNWWVRSPQVQILGSQVSAPPLNVIATYVDFTTAQWPRPTFNVPRSGAFKITIGANIQNTNTTTSTIWASYRLTGGVTYADHNFTGLSIQGGRLYASRTHMFTGQPAGAGVTVVPVWNISSGSSATASFNNGTIQIELLP